MQQYEKFNFESSSKLNNKKACYKNVPPYLSLIKMKITKMIIAMNRNHVLKSKEYTV